MATVPSLIWVRPSRVARRLLFHLFVIGGSPVREPRRFGAFEKPGAGIGWAKSGRGELQIGDGRWELRPGPDCWLYGTEQPRVFVPVRGQEVVTQMFWFGGPGLDGWLEELDVKRRPMFRMARPGHLHQAYQTMLRLVRHQPRHWEWTVDVTLRAVLREFLLARNLLAPDRQRPPESVGRALDAVARDPSRHWRASELAALAGMSTASFRGLFRATMNESPHDYLQRVRLDLARELLTDPELRIKEIARRLHFSSEQYFSNFFHQHAGASPTEFREHLGLAKGSPARSN